MAAEGKLGGEASVLPKEAGSGGGEGRTVLVYGEERQGAAEKVVWLAIGGLASGRRSGLPARYSEVRRGEKKSGVHENRHRKLE